MEPLITQRTITLPQPSEGDRRAFDQQLRGALGLEELTIPLSVLNALPRALRTDRRLLCALARIGADAMLVSVNAPLSCSLALDLGTTNLVAVLHDTVSRRDLAARSFENPQIMFGSDILTRMHHAMSGRREDIEQALRNGVNELVRSLCREAAIDTRDIHAMTVAGNTAMTHFLLGLDISTIPVTPWTPLVRVPGHRPAASLGIDVHPEAPVYCFPNAGSYVGGDIIAGIIATGLHLDERTSVLVDAGTNAEVVIGNRDWIIVGAGAAGPALEEGISRIGRRATRGIIFDVEIRGRDVTCRTFDGAAAEGICGSGMVSLIHALFSTGIIDQTGTLRPGKNVVDADGEPAFSIACGGADPLLITQTEIRNFLRSKAAMFTLLLTLTRTVGISFRDITNVYVAGALGTGIDAVKAAAIGMLPSWPASAVKAIGNSSLAGCRLLLENGNIADQANSLVERITYKHMHDDPEFMQEFRGAVFIPHTDPELLRTVCPPTTGTKKERVIRR